jgi:hypothetical protein
MAFFFRTELSLQWFRLVTRNTSHAQCITDKLAHNEPNLRRTKRQVERSKWDMTGYGQGGRKSSWTR